MKVIISERQLRQIIESENKISDKKLKMYKETVDELGLDYAAELFDKEPWELIEMGLIEHYDDDLWLDLGDTPIESLGNLKYVGGYLFLHNTPIESLGNLKYVDGGLILSNTSIKNLGNLEKVGDFLDLSNSKIESLGNLEKVGGYLDLQNTPIESLGNLKYVGGYLNLEGCPLSKLSDEEIRSQVEIKGKIYRD
jgi:hypothetical protein